MALDPQPVLQLGKRHDMQEDPNEPGEKPAGSKPSALQDREILADDRHVAFVEISEWTLWFPPLSCCEISRPRSAPAELRPAPRPAPAVRLDRRGTHRRRKRRDVRHFHERTDRSLPARRSGRRAFHDWRWRDAGGPQHRRAWNSLSSGDHALLVDLLYLGSCHDLDAELLEPSGGFLGRDSANVGRIRSPPSIRIIELFAGSMRRKLPRSVTVAICAIEAASSTPVGPPPTSTNVISRERSSLVVGSSASS